MFLFMFLIYGLGYVFLAGLLQNEHSASFTVPLMLTGAGLHAIGFSIELLIYRDSRRELIKKQLPVARVVQ